MSREKTSGLFARARVAARSIGHRITPVHVETSDLAVMRDSPGYNMLFRVAARQGSGAYEIFDACVSISLSGASLGRNNVGLVQQPSDGTRLGARQMLGEFNRSIPPKMYRASRSRPGERLISRELEKHIAVRIKAGDVSRPHVQTRPAQRNVPGVR